MRDIKMEAEKEEMVGLNKPLFFIVITVIIAFITVFVMYKNNVFNPNKKSLLENSYILQSNGNYERIVSNRIINEELDTKTREVHTINSDFSEMSIDYYIYTGSSSSDIKIWYDYSYNSNTNIGEGTFAENVRTPYLVFYTATYDFNTGAFSCNADKYLCDMYMKRIVELKGKYNSLIKK